MRVKVYKFHFFFQTDHGFVIYALNYLYDKNLTNILIVFQKVAYKMINDFVSVVF